MAAPVRTAAQPQVALVPQTRKARRWSTGHIVMIVAGLLGAVLTLLALRATDARVEVSVASTNLSAGTRVSAASFTTKKVRLDPTLRASFLNPADVSDAAGSLVLTPIDAGAPIPKSALAKPATRDGRRSLSLPIAPERAVGGKLHNGDRVDVYTTGIKGGLVTTNVEVLDVLRASSGPLSAKDSLTVVLAVASEQAAKLAPIVGATDVSLVQATGATPKTPPTSAPAVSAAPIEGTPGG